ncbi:MAG TPA: rubrerythrin family protein [Spirochaetes bacterium]|nr:rubrerythrin family protein [Spirochaetota bacterium]
MKSKKIALSDELRGILLKAQQAEITEHGVYLKLARALKDKKNRGVMEKIAADELRHYEVLKGYTGADIAPSRLRQWKYYWIARLFGVTFGVKLMERGEKNAQEIYGSIASSIPEIARIEQDEEVHEKKLLDMIDEEKLRYVGSMVLGLNDALVELTGALAGLTFALQSTSKIAFAGFITGVAASLSMAASEFLSTRAEGDGERALRASMYTGTAYVLTVLLLIAPYLVFENYFVCLGFTLLNAILIIFVFNFYISVAKDLSFKKRFFEMAFISLGVAALTFSIGFVIRHFMGVDL